MAVSNLPLVEPGGGATRPDRVLATVPKAVWERRSCGNGTKGRPLLRLGRRSTDLLAAGGRATGGWFPMFTS
jgi:hypothetical protein